MPTYDWTDRFARDYQSLTPAQQAAFLSAVGKLVSDLKGSHLRKGLRVKPYRGAEKTFEMTWAPNGRALFKYGDPVRSGHQHIIWLRVGTHDIFEER